MRGRQSGRESHCFSFNSRLAATHGVYAEIIVRMPSRLSWIVLLAAARMLAQQYPFQLVPNSPKEGTLLEDSRGRLWVSSPGGLRYFDGATFYRLSALDGGTALTEDSEGGIWIESDGGLYRYYRGKAEQIAKGIGTARSAVAVGPGTLLVSIGPNDVNQDAWLFRIQYHQGSWNIERIIDLQSAGALTVDNKGMLLFVCRPAWCEAKVEDIKRWQSGAEVPVIRHLLPTPSDYGAVKVIRDRSGCVWMRSEPHVEYQCPNDPGQQTLPYEIASMNPRADISEANDGSIIIASASSLAVGRPGRFAIAYPSNGLPAALYAIQGKDGTIWISSTQGLYRFPYPFRLEYWTERDGLVTPNSIARIGDRTFAASGRGISILRKDRGAWQPLSLPVNFEPFWHLLPSQNGTLLAAAPDGMAEIRPNGTIVARSPPGSGLWGAHLAQSADGQIWLSGFGIDRVTRRGNSFVKEPENVPQPLKNGLDIEFEKKTGRLAACYAGGLTIREAGAWRTITTKEGLLQNPCRSFAVHPNGDIWYGYNVMPAFALVREKAGEPTIVRQFRGVGEVGAATALFFDVDNRGWLWRGGPDGVYAADPASAKTGTWLHLDGVDGLPALYSNQQSFYSDSDGSVWWAADNTITHFNPPSDFIHQKVAPQVTVSGYSWNSNEPKLADEVQSFPHGATVTAHIGSLQFDRRSALRIRYRLLPEQSTWRDSRNLDLPLGKLPWGGHTLEVQARLLTGPWSVTQRHSFKVLKPVWLSWPILLACAASIFTAGATSYKWRKKRAARAKKAFPDLAEWRFAALSPEAHQLDGTVLDSRYEVGHLLARGGFAAVFKGRDLQQGNAPCAIKVFRQELVDKAWIARRFQQEVSALEQIRHPNVVSILGHGTTPGGAPYLVMEFIEGQTLRDLLETGALPLARAGTYLRQAGSALDQIHAREICHRDLKPENLMIRSNAPPDGDLVLIDFSIAIVKEPDETIHGLSRAAGTLYYMAPEQGIGYASAASDIYSLAKITVEMLTGLRLNLLLPDASMDLPQRLHELLVGSGFGLSAESIQLLSSALEFNPADRPQSALGFAGRIAQDLAG